MARCNGCIHENVCDREAGYGYFECPHYINAADVAPRSEVARDTLLYEFSQTFRRLHKDLVKASYNLERYGRRIREQREEILDLLAKLDGAIAGQETLQKALAERSKNENN